MYCFFFNDTATTEIYTLSLHDALPIFLCGLIVLRCRRTCCFTWTTRLAAAFSVRPRRRGTSTGKHRSEEHTSELQSRQYLVCRLLLEKKNNHLHISDGQSNLLPLSTCH